MASMQRKLARGIIRQKCYKRDGNIKAFRSEWYAAHYGKNKRKNNE